MGNFARGEPMTGSLGKEQNKGKPKKDKDKAVPTKYAAARSPGAQKPADFAYTSPWRMNCPSPAQPHPRHWQPYNSMGIIQWLLYIAPTHALQSQLLLAPCSADALADLLVCCLVRHLAGLAAVARSPAAGAHAALARHQLQLARPTQLQAAGVVAAQRHGAQRSQRLPTS
ncbi:hypothetical protein COO60DRAFT_1538046 [Scenedesmus sp. NREL 46B-D3]|nr:hypothetical protein COO60DRAFT_1538046 [Scenedesmus sp. NREL 46B-D3]